MVIGCFVAGMLLTPAQPLLTVPMWLLFEVGALCGGLVRKRSHSNGMVDSFALAQQRADAH